MSFMLRLVYSLTPRAQKSIYCIYFNQILFNDKDCAPGAKAIGVASYGAVGLVLLPQFSTFYFFQFTLKLHEV